MDRIINKINELLKDKKYIVIAIDGMAASGKTTLANELSKQYDLNIIHCDDFFLPFNKRSKVRLSEPGGNIDYERMYEEVIANLNNSEIKYKPFNCNIMDYDKEISLSKKRITIIEGSYSLHPYFKDYYDLSIYLKIDEKLQKERIIKRNGAILFNRFINEWIPMENRYKEEFDILNKVDIIMNVI